jgi:hypothetical protein
MEQAFAELVHPTGIEPVSTVPETAVLSVELRVQLGAKGLFANGRVD